MTTARKVLIVEDELIVQLHLRRIVEEIGHHICGAAASAEQALQFAEKDPPELVLMDIQLAAGGDGVETARLLRERFDCAVVFITANADTATVERSEIVGAAGYLVKPFTKPGVRAAIATAFVGHDRLQQAQQRERSFASVLASLGDALLVTDSQLRISFANPRAGELIGRPLSQLYDEPINEVLEFAASSDSRALADAFERCESQREPESISRLELLDSNGDEHPISIHMEAVVEQGRAMGLVVSIHDLTREPSPASSAASDSLAPFGAGTRLLVYSHDTLGLGHLQRSLNLIRALLERHPALSILLVTGSPMVHRYAMPQGADYLKLPSVRKVGSDRYEARSLSVPESGIHTLRRNLLLRTVRDYDPNVLLVDHSPTGMLGELRPSLDWLQSQGHCTRILGLRDIIDDPDDVVAQWEEQGVYDVLRELYDQIVVYGSREIYDTVASYRFPADLASKAQFVNYVCAQQTSGRMDDNAEVAAPAEPSVVVSIGGGDGGADAVIGSFLTMIERFSSQVDFHGEILTGAFIDPDQLERFQAQARDLPVTIHGFVPSARDLIRRADLVVSTAGYNTCADLLSYARRAILIPRVMHRQEQLIRARRLAELGLVDCLHPDEVTPALLFNTIRAARSDAREPLSEARAAGTVALDGAERFADFCAGLQIRQ